MLVGCGGGGEESLASPGQGGGGPVSPKTCQEAFSTKRVESGENCAPVYHAFCPSAVSRTPPYRFDEVAPCDGVRVDTIRKPSSESFSGELDYVVLQPANARPQAVVVALHWLNSDAETFAVQMRFSELAKGRQVMVVLPNAPGRVWPQPRIVDTIAEIGSGALLERLLSGLLDNGLIEGISNGLRNLLGGLGLPLPVPDPGIDDELLLGIGDLLQLGDLALLPGLNAIDDFMDYIELARDDARALFNVGSDVPVYIAGLSNGGVMALRFACERGEGVEGVLAVATSMGLVDRLNCVGRSPVATVQVHGTLDPLSPYIGTGVTQPVPVIHQTFLGNNGCTGTHETSIATPDAATGPIVFSQGQNCSSGLNSILVTVKAGGHNWPGFDNPVGLPFNLLGPITKDFDATLQGFDLLLQAAGH
jgi:poly(3-hydroxybutyrate) depolymerase